MGSAPTHGKSHSAAPLCVDLDGTLVKTDTLVDSVLALARQNPRALLQIPGWLAKGKAAFKQHVTSAVTLDVSVLPYNEPLMHFLVEQRAAGRPIYLATAADRNLADRIAAHHPIFAGVLASEGGLNLAGENKLAAFREHFGEDFCYIGNARPDLPILSSCVEPMVANPTAGLMAGLRAAKVLPARIFRDQQPTLKAWLKAIRLHQWAKNVLIFLPFLLAHAWNLSHRIASAVGILVAFLSFGLCASATYIVNDLLDIEADRKHHRKRNRPFAAGTTTAYSLVLKRVVLVDVIVLSGLYTVRIFAGAAAGGVPVSKWLGGFSVFFFLSLAFVKRFAELESLRRRDKAPTNGRGYLMEDIEQLRSFGTAAAYASVVVLILYISSLDTHLYHRPGLLWLLLPVLLLWVSQLWLLASRGQLNEDPVVYALTDKRSLLLGVLVAGVVLSAL
jgi:4-hydroxybenzoate polyprenyltransferase